MSLVNDLLRDLDAQQRRPDQGGEQPPLAGALVKPTRSTAMPVLVTLLVVLVVGAVTFLFWPEPEPQTEADVTVTPDVSAPVDAIELAQMQARLAEIEAQVAQAFADGFLAELLSATVEPDALQRVTEQVADLLPEPEAEVSAADMDASLAQPVVELEVPESAPPASEEASPGSVSIAPTRETVERQRAEAVYEQAQALLAQGRATDALALLEADLASAEGDEAYRALTAGLQFQQGDHAAAANQYRRLLSDFGEEPVYWLGLALALEQQGHDASALEAYRRARSGEQRPRVIAFIEQQIAALSRTDSESNHSGDE